MPTSRPASLGAIVLAALLAVVAALAGPAHAAAGPLGGDRLQGLDVVTAGGPDLAPPPVTAASYVVADLDSGAVLAAKDPHGRYAPASTLKTLTAVTLIPRLDPAALLTPAFEDVAVDGSRVGLVEQLSYSVHDLFSALLVVSANDAAGTLAGAVGGQAAAADLLNAEATRLQAQDTHAVNTSGLDADGQVSSAYDLALIARAGMAVPDFRAYVATTRSSIPAPGGTTMEIDNHNRLLGSYEGALGIKNGYTDAARASFVAAATRGGRTVVVALMRADPAVWKEAAALLDWGFAATQRGDGSVGQLVDPLPAGQASAAPVPEAGVTLRAAAVRAEHDGGSPVVPVAVAAGLLGGLVVLRRRAVVRQRARRRGARPARVAGVRSSAR